MTHQSPSPLCDVDKGRLADLPRSAGVGNRTGRSEATMVGPGELVGGSWGTRQQDQRTQLRNDWREKTLQYIILLAIYTAKRQLLSQMQCIVVSFYTHCHK